ncbi:MAG: hypothetical protein V1740_00500 [Candidatus Woesearchaeota archaeon]
MANQERKIREFKKRIRIKGKVIDKGTTKNGNIILSIEKDGETDKFTILKTHKESFALAEKLKKGNSVSIEGIPKFRMIICTRLKLLEKGLKQGKQAKLDQFEVK